jgi:hypothetical protein
MCSWVCIWHDSPSADHHRLVIHKALFYGTEVSFASVVGFAATEEVSNESGSYCNIHNERAGIPRATADPRHESLKANDPLPKNLAAII